MSKVIYLPYNGYYPDEKEIKRLDDLQVKMELYCAEIAYQGRDLNQWQMMIFKEKSHHNVRKSWKVLRGQDVQTPTASSESSG